MSEKKKATNERQSEQSRFPAYICIPIVNVAVLAELRAAGRRLPTREEHKYHITLRYVHEAEADGLSALQAAVRSVCLRHRPFELTLGKPGFFPGTVWQGVEHSALLLALQADIDSAVAALEYPPADYDYNPHITLGYDNLHPFVSAVEPVVWTVDTLEIRKSVTGGDNELINAVDL